jgi:hypothetical protein
MSGISAAYRTSGLVALMANVLYKVTHHKIKKSQGNTPAGNPKTIWNKSAFFSGELMLSG